jgi:mannose-1-phosphate guanylyltransferase
MYAVILAGGGGTRLWPLSRSQRPKPFLPLLEGGRCLLAATVERLAPLVKPEDVYVVTDVRYHDLVREVVPAVPAANIVGEPMGRNTAAAVALAAHAIDRPADDVMISLHADQAIADEAGFRAVLAAAVERAGAGDIVTLGIEPAEPATGFGYILATAEATAYADRDTYRVERFEEKPTPERAVELVESRRAYWNAGAFVWRRDTLLDGLARHAPAIDGPMREWFAAPGDDLVAMYATLPSEAIDYALLEPASLEALVAVVPAAIGWSDLGSWSALRDHRGGDGTAVISEEAPARVIDVGTRDVLVHAAGGRSVAVVGLEGIVVVDTPDALLVISADAAQDVKKVVKQLKDEGRDDLL